MECNKRKRGLDKSTRRIVSALDALIRETIEDSRPPGKEEFTAADYVNGLQAGGLEISLDGAFKRLTRKVRKGELASRQAKVDGSTINIYRAGD
mgnify:CR=1 FL=1